MSHVPAFFAGYQARIEESLQRVITAAGTPAGTTGAADGSPIERSMAYTLFAPSKRIRPVLTLLSAELCGGQAARALAAGAAMELVHTSSLILDDLPSMDDAALRRGRPANHLAFGEAIAILAAFGLLNLAYGTLARDYDPPLSTRLATLLDDAVGTNGLIAGQAADLLATEQEIGFELLEFIHRGKTGALFSASAVAGALTAGADAEAVAALSAFAKNLGLAFQIIDDLLDVEGDPAQTGKAIRSDARKTTFVSFSGVEGARMLARELCDTADRALQPFGRRADRLRELSAFVAGRSL
jgi:geranylgeranyl diphosphate synthase type II